MSNGALPRRNVPPPGDGSADLTPLFVFNVKLFDDRQLPPVLGALSQWPHSYVVVIRRPDGTAVGDGPLRTRPDADTAASRARVAHPGSRVHIVVALDESDDALDAFFAARDSVQFVAEEGARARERYEEWRRKAGAVSAPSRLDRCKTCRGPLPPTRVGYCSYECGARREPPYAYPASRRQVRVA